MGIEALLGRIPLLPFYGGTVLVVLASLVVGFRLGGYIRQRRQDKDQAPLGTIVGAMLGLLAFLLAFTFGMAASRFDARKTLLLDEVNAIGTLFLRTDLLPEPNAAEAKSLVRNYVDIRAGGAGNLQTLPQAIADSEALHERLWSQVTTLAKQGGNAVLLSCTSSR